MTKINEEDIKEIITYRYNGVDYPSKEDVLKYANISENGFAKKYRKLFVQFLDILDKEGIVYKYKNRRCKIEDVLELIIGGTRYEIPIEIDIDSFFELYLYFGKIKCHKSKNNIITNIINDSHLEGGYDDGYSYGDSIVKDFLKFDYNKKYKNLFKKADQIYSLTSEYYKEMHNIHDYMNIIIDEELNKIDKK